MIKQPNHLPHAVLYRGNPTSFMDDSTLERIGLNLRDVAVARSFNSTRTGFLMFLSTDPTHVPPTVKGINWVKVEAAPNSLGSAKS